MLAIACFLVNSRPTREGMSVFNHILLSPGYAPGTIAVNVTWIKREFNACQMHRSMYRLRAIARYWSEIATFSYPLAFNAPVRSGPWENRGKCYIREGMSVFNHILLFPGYAHGTIAVNVTWIER